MLKSILILSLVTLSPWVWSAVTTATSGATPPSHPFTARRSLYCSGTRMGLTYVWNEAVCFGHAPWRLYRLRVVGAGATVQLVGSLMRLQVDYPVDRYDAAFDPWPGEYFAMITGVAFGPRGHGEISAHAGNKTIRGISYDLGLGLDVTLASLLVIE